MRPTVPILKNPKLQKIIVIAVVEILTAIKYLSFSMWPISPVSIIPTRGMARFEKKMGIEHTHPPS